MESNEETKALGINPSTLARDFYTGESSKGPEGSGDPRNAESEIIKPDSQNEHPWILLVHTTE